MATTSTADLVFVLKARDEASKTFKQVQRETEKTSTSFASFGKTLVKMSVAAFTVQKALSWTTGAIAATRQSLTTADFALRTLGYDSETILAGMGGAFQRTAVAVKATEAEVRNAYGLIVRETGRAEVSTEALEAVFNLARVAGLDFNAAAVIIGKALIGDVEALRQITGPSGLKSVEQAFKDLAASAKVAEDPTLAISAAWKRLIEFLGEGLRKSFADPMGLIKEVAEFLQVSFKAIANTLAGLVDNKVVQAVLSGVSKTIDWTINFFTNTIPEIISKVVDAGSKAYDWTVNLLKGTVESFIKAVWDAGDKTYNWTVNLLKGTVESFIKAVWDAGDKTYDWTVNFIKGTVASLISDVWGGVKTAYNWTVNLLQGTLFPFIGWIIRTAATGVDIVVNFIPGAINAVKHFVNMVIDLLNIALDKVPWLGEVLQIPRFPEEMAHGGVVTKPTLAMIGERGPEAVIPLGAAPGGAGVTVNLNVGTLVVDNDLRQRQVARELQRLLSENVRRGVSI